MGAFCLGMTFTCIMFIVCIVAKFCGYDFEGGKHGRNRKL